MKWYWLPCTLIFIVWLSWTVGATSVYAADDPTATLTAAQPTLTVGDLITLTLAVTHSVDAGIVPVAPAQQWGAFEVRTLSPVSTAEHGDGSATSYQALGVTLWMTGTYGTPPLPVTLVDGAGQQHELLAQPISLTVTSVLTSSDLALRDLKPQATLPIPPLWPWLLGGVVGSLLLGSGSWWLYSRWRGRTTGTTALPSLRDLRPAYQIALDDLDQLQQLQLPAQRRFQEHYTLATDALRRYLTGAFAIPAIDQTTNEIRQALRQSALPSTARTRLLDLLSEADLVKFANVEPEPRAAEALLREARAFVLETKPAPAPPPGTGAGDHGAGDNGAGDNGTINNTARSSEVSQ